MIDNVGAYSIDMNNSFIDPPLPVLVKCGDSWAPARHAPTFEEALAGFSGLHHLLAAPRPLAPHRSASIRR